MSDAEGIDELRVALHLVQEKQAAKDMKIAWLQEEAKSEGTAALKSQSVTEEL